MVLSVSGRGRKRGRRGRGRRRRSRTEDAEITRGEKEEEVADCSRIMNTRKAEREREIMAEVESIDKCIINKHELNNTHTFY